MPAWVARTAGSASTWIVRAMCAFAALGVLASLWWPFGHDQIVFALNGATVLRGGLPYRDAWELRGPLAFYGFAAIESVFGRSALGLRIFDVLLLAWVNWAIWHAVRRATTARAATFAVALWTLTYLGGSFSDTAQPDLWVGYLMLGSALAISRPGGYRTRDLVLTAVAVGLCTLLKPFYALFLLVPGSVVLLRRYREPMPLVREMAVLALAWLAPIAVVLGVLYAAGAFEEFVAVHLLYNLRMYLYFGAPTLAGRARGLLDYVWKGPIMPVALAGLICGAAVLRRREPARVVALLAVVAVGVASVVLQAKFYSYHWEPMMPAAAVLTAIGLGAVAHGERSVGGERHGRTLAVALTAVLTLHVSILPASLVVGWLKYVAGRQSAEQYYGAFGRYALVNPGEQMATARYVQARTPPDAIVGYWGDGGVALLADRRPVSRFPSTRLLEVATESPITRSYRQELLNDVRTRRPVYFVAATKGFLFGLPVRSMQESFPELGALVNAEYVLDASIGGYAVYRRRDYRPTTR